MMIIKVVQFLSLMNQYSYEVNYGEDTKPYNLNIVGFRNKFGRPNFFDDTIAVYYQSKNEWISEFYEATTLPGYPSLLKPVNSNGTAILLPGQYKNGYRIGLHKGYKALTQNKPVRVYRDNNKDLVYDVNNRSVEEGFFGINIHRASLNAKIVGPESAGCQVIKKRSDYERFMYLCGKHRDFNGPTFTYTLVEI